MSIGIEQIIWAIVAAIIAYLGFTTGRKVERPRAIQEGKNQAANEIQRQTTEQAFERVTHANEAGAAVERLGVDGLREQAGRDPNNRGRVQRP